MNEESSVDARIEAIIEARFKAVIEASPVFATSLGIHEHDSRLADLSRGAKLAEMAAERAFVDELEAVDTATVTDLSLPDCVVLPCASPTTTKNSKDLPISTRFINRLRSHCRFKPRPPQKWIQPGNSG